MAKLRLDRLPDRTPVRITVALSPVLNKALNDYVRIYHQQYGGQKEKVEDLIPFMLDKFIDGDAGFKKARREMNDAENTPPPARKHDPHSLTAISNHPTARRPRWRS